MHRDVEQADVDVAALSGLVRAQDAGEQAGRAGGAGHEVDHRAADARRRTVRLAGQAHDAGFRLHQEVVAGPALALVVAAVGRDVQADDLRIDVLQARVVEPELLRLVAAQIVHHGVGAFHELLEAGAALRGLDVERDALLVHVPGLEILAVAVRQHVRADVARGIAAGFGVLDLDHLGAEVGEQHRGIGTGAELLEGEDANAFERLHALLLRLIHCLAMIRRCISLVPSPMQVSGASR